MEGVITELEVKRGDGNPNVDVDPRRWRFRRLTAKRRGYSAVTAPGLSPTRTLHPSWGNFRLGGDPTGTHSLARSLREGNNCAGVDAMDAGFAAAVEIALYRR